MYATDAPNSTNPLSEETSLPFFNLKIVTVCRIPANTTNIAIMNKNTFNSNNKLTIITNIFYIILNITLFVNYPQTRDLWASDFIADCP